MPAAIESDTSRFHIAGHSISGWPRVPRIRLPKNSSKMTLPSGPAPRYDCPARGDNILVMGWVNESRGKWGWVASNLAIERRPAVHAHGR